MPLINVIPQVRRCNTIHTPSTETKPDAIRTPSTKIIHAVSLPDIHLDLSGITYISQNKKETLLVRLNDPALDDYIKIVKDYLDKTMGKPISHEKEFNLDNLEKFLLNLITFVSLNPHFKPNVPKARADFYGSHTSGATLGELLTNNLFMCRERSMMLHILLAEYGFSSNIIYGRKPNYLSKEMDSHEWVACEITTPTNELLNFVLDPSYGNLRRGNYNENYDYMYDIMWLSAVNPRQRNHFFKGPSHFD